jgi:ribonuclease HII
LAGPVVAAAVILAPGWNEAVRLDDSKRLTPEEREAAFPLICSRALAWRAAVVPAEEIDRINILQATLAAMARAVGGLKVDPEWVLVDGNRLPAPEARVRRNGCLSGCGWECLVKGDSRSATIAAASIVAKVVRDRLMRAYAQRFPEWGFAEHKGYGTAAHVAAIQRHGPSPLHRRSFRVAGRYLPPRETQVAAHEAAEGPAWAERMTKGPAARTEAAGTTGGGAPAPTARRWPPGTWND